MVPNTFLNVFFTLIPAWINLLGGHCSYYLASVTLSMALFRP